MTAAAQQAGFDRRLISPMILGAILNPINSSMIAVALIPIGVALAALVDRSLTSRRSHHRNFRHRRRHT